MMPRYMIERVFGEAVEEDMARIGSNSKRVLKEDFPDMTWEYSYVVSDVSGIKTFCVYEAPDAERVRKHAERFGEHVVTQLYEIDAVVTPADFAG
jgi:Protein of unknown function (DUF4242)